MVRCLRDRMGFEAGRPDGGGAFQSARYQRVRLHVASDDLLHQESLDDVYPQATAYIFLSKHKSDSKIPTLTCHCTGNFDANPYGGNPREIAISYPSLQKRYLQALSAAKDRVPRYDITIEASHHGPTSLKKPVLFVELGSSESEWADENAASAICSALISVLDEGFDICESVGIALGGTHYPAKFNKLLLESELGLAAVASKHNLEAIDKEMLDQMISKSIEPVTKVIVDSKGLGNQKERIMKMADQTGLEIVKV
jgi:D-aminoacyl-tRNA deacylase